MKVLLTAFLLFNIFSVSAQAVVQIKVAEAPTTSLALTLKAIRSAETYLLINIYELSSNDVAQAIIEKVQAGIHVELLEEGQPVGGMSDEAKAIRSQITKAMRKAGQEDHFFVMSSKPVTTSSAKSVRRYRFDHAKYIVADGETLLIGSENYSSGGQPIPGRKGNRGWEVWIRDNQLTQYFKHIFRVDSDTSIGDVVDLLDRSSGTAAEEILALSTVAARPGSEEPEFPTLEAERVAPVVSPETSLKALVKLIDNARESIDIEQMTFDSKAWGGYNGHSPLIDAVVRAARRGVRIRALLNDESVFNRGGDDSSAKNTTTRDLLNSLAAREKLRLRARIANLKAMRVNYIHNKGMLIDGRYTLVSSINWGENSVMRNREAAVAIDGTPIYDHYEELFESDWKSSEE